MLGCVPCPLPLSGIYIHIPFCASRCIYCDFYSTTLRNKAPQYIAALVNEMEERKVFLHEPVRTIYLGGGTPTQLSPAEIASILLAIASHFDLSDCEEITMEANPEDFITGPWSLSSPSKPCFAASFSPRITRLSLGVQSMVDSELHLLHRRHNAAHVREAVKRLREADIRNISLDLMYGLPTQTLQSWEYSIDEVLKLHPQHISAYNLSVEESTPLNERVAKGELTPCDDDTCLQMAALLRQKLKAAGFEQYEISNYALPGYYSRHNSSYWTPIPYLGLGPGAHSYDGDRRRSWNLPDLNQYLKGVRQEESETLSDLDLYNERILLGLRTAQGLDLHDLVALLPKSNPAISSQTTAQPTHSLSTLHTTIDSLTHRNLLQLHNNRLSLTEPGLSLADEVIRELIIID